MGTWLSTSCPSEVPPFTPKRLRGYCRGLRNSLRAKLNCEPVVFLSCVGFGTKSWLDVQWVQFWFRANVVPVWRCIYVSRRRSVIRAAALSCTLGGFASGNVPAHLTNRIFTSKLKDRKIASWIIAKAKKKWYRFAEECTEVSQW